MFIVSTGVATITTPNELLSGMLLNINITDNKDVSEILE